MKIEWKAMRIDGLISTDGSPFVIRVFKPVCSDDYFSCKVSIPGYFEKEIFQETELSAFTGALKFVDKVLSEPPGDLLAKLQSSEDDFFDLVVTPEC